MPFATPRKREPRREVRGEIDYSHASMPSRPRLALIVIPLALTALAACSRDSAPPVAPVELAIAPIPDGGAGPGTGALAASSPPSSYAAGDRDRCEARLVPDTIQTQAGCQLDERLTTGPGRLSFPCSGDGPVEAVFNEHRFEGSVTGGSVALTLLTELDWQDGCHWQTRQTIRGSLRALGASAGASATEKAATPKLVWSYTEGPVSGSNCYLACKAKADITVERR